MRILSRYVLRQHIAPFTFAVSALTLLMLLDQLAKQFHKLVGKGLGAGAQFISFMNATMPALPERAAPAPPHRCDQKHPVCPASRPLGADPTTMLE